MKDEAVSLGFQVWYSLPIKRRGGEKTGIRKRDVTFTEVTLGSASSSVK